jgi:site-specific DNA recombinase
MRTESGGYRRDHLRALAQRVEVDAKEVRIIGSKSVLLRTKWRGGRDSNWP